MDVAVHSRHPVHLVLRDRAVPLIQDTGGLFVANVPDVLPGDRYCLRVQDRLLLDPWAVDLEQAPWAVVRDPWEPPRAGPARAWRDQVVYELQVGAFTAQHPAVPSADRGTLRGLHHPAVIEHLLALGVTAVELMPITAWRSELWLQALGMRNTWGYNPISFFAPEPSLGSVEDTVACIDALHEAGLSVILDVVVNHTCEGPLGPDGMTVSWRGFDERWYATDASGDLVNRTGCGNTLDLGWPVAQRCVMDSLRHWAQAYSVDGFRFDLAAAVVDGNQLLEAIGSDSVLADRILIAEPWDAAGLDMSGRFPAPWAEWSHHWRDAARSFWLGEGNRSVDARREMGSLLTGSASLLEHTNRPPSSLVSFVTCHDGFTLSDLTSYEEKHNEANGEDNRDGTDDNRSSNAGIEGPTDDPAILAVRRDWQRALLATILLGPAVPMIGMGSELGFSQGGNNNGYCQPFEVPWDCQVHIDWISSLCSLRRELGLARPTFADPQQAKWWRTDGTSMSDGDWGQPGPLLLELDGHVLIGLNPLPVATELTLPGPDWRLRLASVPGNGLPPRSVSVWSR